MKNNILVLLSSYNGEKYIKEQIDSILNQKTEYEVDLLIRDDGSTDGTRNILKEYKETYADRVQIVYGENIGYIRSFFELIKMADGHKYYALSDQDDVWLENKLDAAVKMCDEENTELPLLYGSSSCLVNTALEPFGETQKQLREITFYNTIIQNFFPGHTQVFNEPLCQLLKKEIDYSKIYVHDSWITNIAILYGKVIFDNHSYTLYRQHGSNEVGFGKGIVGWIQERIKRVKKNDNKKYSEQIHYFYEECHRDMDESQKNEMKKFIDSQVSWIKRVRYLFVTKMYRQRTFETVLFKLLYVSGGYKIKR